MALRQLCGIVRQGQSLTRIGTTVNCACGTRFASERASDPYSSRGGAESYNRTSAQASSNRNEGGGKGIIDSVKEKLHQAYDRATGSGDNNVTHNVQSRTPSQRRPMDGTSGERDAERVIDKAKEDFTEGYHRVEEAAQKGKHRVQEMGQKAANRSDSWTESVKDMAEDGADYVKKTAQKAERKLEDWAGDAKDKSQDWAGDTKRKAQHGKQKADQWADEAKDAAERYSDEAESGLKRGIDKTRQKVKEGLNKVQKKADEHD